MKDVVIAGGGLAGLTAAAYLARKGHRVKLFEKKRELGGRAATHEEQGFRANLGPHALYRGSRGIEVLRELGIEPKGGIPPAAGNLGLWRGAIEPLPAGPFSLLFASFLPAAAKLEVGKALVAAQRAVKVGAATTLEEWVASHASSPEARAVLHAFFRVATYANAPSRTSAAAALAQVKKAASKNVLYLDRGWSSLVDALREKAVAAGAELRSDLGVQAVLQEGGAVTGVRLSSGAVEAADAVILAVPPHDAAALSPPAAAVTEGLEPVRAACLDVALSSLPSRRGRFVLGLDRPLYLSVHSMTAAGLAPEGGALVHAARYGGAEAGEAAEVEAELEGLLDLAQPGWRERVVWRRFMPKLVVTHALVRAGPPRPAARVPGVRGLWVAGDWVGGEGMLADAALASAREAAEEVESVELDRRVARVA